VICYPDEAAWGDEREELQEFRARYAAIVTAWPMLIEHVIESEQAEQIPLNLNDQGTVEEA
jgi:hypothetical protein